MFLWPFGGTRRERNHIFLWPAQLLEIDESSILIRSMTGVIICSDSCVIFFSHSKIRSEKKAKPREGESNWHVLSFVCHMCVKWELTIDSGNT